MLVAVLKTAGDHYKLGRYGPVKIRPKAFVGAVMRRHQDLGTHIPTLGQYLAEHRRPAVSGNKRKPLTETCQAQHQGSIITLVFQAVAISIYGPALRSRGKRFWEFVRMHAYIRRQP